VIFGLDRAELFGDGVDRLVPGNALELAPAFGPILFCGKSTVLAVGALQIPRTFVQRVPEVKGWSFAPPLSRDAVLDGDLHGAGSGQSCGQAARTTLRSTELFVGPAYEDSAILRRSGAHDRKRSKRMRSIWPMR